MENFDVIHIKLDQLVMLLGIVIVTLIVRVNTNLNPIFSLMSVTSCVILVLKVNSIIKQRKKKLSIFSRGNVPSIPTKSSFAGNIFEVIMNKDSTLMVDKYHKKLGKTYGLFFGPDPWIQTIDLDLLQEVFCNQDLVDMPNYRLPFTTEINKSLGQLQGEEWRAIRKLLNPPFSHKQVKMDDVYGEVEDSCNKFLNCIENHPLEPHSSADNRRSHIVDCWYNFQKYSIQVIFQVAFGKENGINMEAGGRDLFIDELHEASKLVIGPIAWLSVMFVQFQHFFGYLAKFTKLNKYIKNIHSILDQTLVERRQFLKQIPNQQQEARSEGRKIIDIIISNFDKAKLDDETLKANLFFTFIAGFETSSTTLTILFWYLAKQQVIQEKLREAVKVEGERAYYLDWCIKEALRLYPAVPGGVGRVVKKDFTTPKGETIFAGTTVLPSFYTIQRSQEYWGSDVEDFKPERFSEPLKHPLQFFPFSTGPRDCIGRHLAMVEMRAITSRLITRYIIEPCATTPEKINFTTPNLIHMILESPIDLRFVEL